MNVIKVGMADLNIASSPDRIRTVGLGSCVGVALYDKITKIGGLAHIMLPSSTLNKGVLNVAKYADTAIPKLIDDMVKKGADSRRIIAKIAGGAQMFSFSSASEIMRIGPRNVEACKEALRHARIHLNCEDTGGNWGRTIEMDCSTGVLQVRSVNNGVKEF
ncbi:chemotaxis protein CheD [Ammoniphilus resinae]|uniref:Probable chemoreceptor glutamine deamidase CheD n=1 Tax=Ammoniphilus resinae TaxID=861532 RepID=A0ABS4GML5_9BACL|nr:chemotaxis protein CheD [Ammoniphilus resinae]MBP1931518.1 chemotaxis protein CheD [Ammoniphilus resinae]